MKSDIPQYKVEDLAIAIVPPDEGLPSEDELWDTFLINFKEEPIKSVLVSSKGYGEVDGKEMRTTVLRHFFEEIGPMEIVQIEPIQSRLFSLTNEYWVSFVFNEHMYDKKYVFVQGSILERNFTVIPFLNKKGVMIR